MFSNLNAFIFFNIIIYRLIYGLSILLLRIFFVELRTGNVSQKSVALISYALVAILELGERLAAHFAHAIHKFINIYAEYIYFLHLVLFYLQILIEQSENVEGK